MKCSSSVISLTMKWPSISVSQRATDLIAIALTVVVVITHVRPSDANNTRAGICANQPDGTVFNNPASCRAFWECRNGVAAKSFCQIGSNFHPTLLVCQLESHFPCTDPEAPADEFRCPATGIAALPLPDSCTAFRFCFMGALSVRQCAPNTLFDREILKCNRRSLVDCAVACPERSDPAVVITLPSRTHCERYLCSVVFVLVDSSSVIYVFSAYQISYLLQWRCGGLRMCARLALACATSEL